MSEKNLSKNIFIKTNLSVGDGEASEMFCNSFQGEWRTSDGRHCLSHDEPENQGRTLILIDTDSVEIRRTGLVCSRLRFSDGRELPAKYSTPYGKIPMTVSTKTMSRDMTPESGNLHIRYTIHSDSGAETLNTLHIEWNTKI
ncbi:MAG: DUF1934 domain-containing protein [Alloprevotella sp.]|nr:DUF1934 domain-containing protein [Alloprevotella sp.]MBR6374844.1 DUF1934 domain-containing protein [Alloprevotella sp.]